MEDQKQQDVPMVPKHWAEMMMHHMSRAIRTIVIGFTVGFALMALMAYIFVTAYNSRTKDWLSTYANLQEKPAVTEVDNGIQQQPDP